MPSGRLVARGRDVHDFRLSPKRDVAAAKAFFRKAFKTQGRVPRTITLDGYQGFPSGRP
jgi:putative transposase